MIYLGSSSQWVFLFTWSVQGYGLPPYIWMAPTVTQSNLRALPPIELNWLSASFSFIALQFTCPTHLPAFQGKWQPVLAIRSLPSLHRTCRIRGPRAAYSSGVARSCLSHSGPRGVQFRAGEFLACKTGLLFRAACGIQGRYSVFHPFFSLGRYGWECSKGIEVFDALY